MSKIRLIIRADDIGYSEAVNYGIEKAVKEGLVRSAGLMPNMPAAAHGIKLLEGSAVCIGQHTNLCVGRPCADPARIPSLVDAQGNLKSSRTYRDTWMRGEEFAVLEELVIEIEAQYLRFRELVGRDPGYFECHAVMSKNIFKGLELVAEKYGLKYHSMRPKSQGLFNGKPIYTCAMDSVKADYDPWQSLKNAVMDARTDMSNVYVCHPGYLDDFILQNSSLTVNRTKEVAMLTDPAMKDWLQEKQIELITYDDV